MNRWKIVATIAGALAAQGWPAVAAANGEHVQVGSAHFDPVIGIFVGVWIALMVLLFVGQWVRFNVARRRAAGSATSRELARKREEATDDGGEGDE